MEQTWLERLQRDDIVLIDGGTGSELQRRGVAMNPIAWSGLAARQQRATLRDIHADFIRAGADIVTANTFGSTRYVLEAAGYGAEFEAINEAALDAAREARDSVGRTVAIAGSMSCLPPGFDDAAYPPPDEEADAYRELAQLLVCHGVDLIALEMVQDIEHGGLALEAALATGLPVCIGVSARRAGDRLACFDYPDRSFAGVIDALVERNPAVVNVMHTPPEDVCAAIDTVRRRWRGPLGVYPELGDFTAPDRQLTSGISPAALTGLAERWVGSGARLLGGCCGTGPGHIAALARARPRLLAARGDG